MKILVASTAALLLLSGASSALASQAQTETVNIAISQNKLDLKNPQDVQRMMRRIDIAALQACGADTHSFTEVKRAVAATPCYRDAVAGAKAQLRTTQAGL